MVIKISDDRPVEKNGVHDARRQLQDHQNKLCTKMDFVAALRK